MKRCIALNLEAKLAQPDDLRETARTFITFYYDMIYTTVR